MEDDNPTVLFDGVCNLCNGAVNFILDRDNGEFRFAALQSGAGRRLIEERGRSAEDLSTMVLIEGERVYTRSSAALRIARRLRAPWKWLYVFIIVPRPLRDAVYNLAARRRYRWFGKREECRMPTPELKGRFLE